MKCKLKNKPNNSLRFAEINKEYKIKNLAEELNPRYARRLCELGFFPGAQVKIIRFSPIGRTLLVTAGGAVVLMRYDLANKIILENFEG